MTCEPVVPCSNIQDQTDPLTGSGPLGLTTQGGEWELVGGGAAARTPTGANILGFVLLRPPCSCDEAHVVCIEAVNTPPSFYLFDNYDGDVAHRWRWDVAENQWFTELLTRPGLLVSSTPGGSSVPVTAGDVICSRREGDTSTLSINAVPIASVSVPDRLRHIGGGGFGGFVTVANFSSTCEPWA